MRRKLNFSRTKINPGYNIKIQNFIMNIFNNDYAHKVFQETSLK